MKKLIVILAVLTFSFSNISAATDTAHEKTRPSTKIKSENKITSKWGYGNELLGAAHLWSFLLTYRFHESFAVNTGFSYILIPGSAYNADFFIMPLTASYLLGIGNHFLETQLGTLIVSPAELGFREAARAGHRASATSEWFVPIAAIGYRYQPKSAGWFFRISLYGVYGRDPEKNIRKLRPWPGISLGRMF